MWLLLLLVAPCLTLKTHEPPPPVPNTRNTPSEEWLDVRLNHFMAFDTDTFKMRYYVNSEFYRSTILIFVGGEWEISPGWVTGGLGLDLARRVGATLFYTEHRFYGQTRPFNDTSVSGLRFLTVDQALADLAQFIQYIKSNDYENGRYRDAKVGLIGCSYAGSMATWMRLAYPHLVDAAFSDSGPLFAQEDFPEYLEVIAEAIRSQGGEACLNSIETSMEGLVQLLATQNGPATVSNMFNTCSTISATAPLDLATFFWYGITETFAYLVQYANPGDIPAACEVLTASGVSDPVQRLANWITSQPWTQPCIETRYSQVVENHRNTSFDSPDAVMRLWTYQTCVEFGWYQTTTSSRQPFLSTVPLEYFHEMCKDFFSSYFNEDLLRSGIDRTNIFFGGGHLPDRVVTVLGGQDPWSPMGPKAAAAHPLAPLHIVPGVSHCMAIGALDSTNITELEAVKRRVLDQMTEFLIGETMASAASSAHVSMALLAIMLAFIHV
ncbi:putative serine protease K12H4.7 [Anticarsia gemmatalis]|uniref:putative serine protease K12H4.7 n=1 Tax=Anticarsia gemmatalis TaxID=129554 RepID=UPI003F75E4AE